MAGSNAVSLERISRIVGYNLTAGDFSNTTPNLPQRIAILAEANEANQDGLSGDGGLPYQIINARDAGKKYGYGSPIFAIARILKPRSGGGVNGIPVWVYPQVKAASATTKKIEISPAGVATGSGTHTVILAGRSGVDAEFYSFTVVKGDTTADLTAKISDVVNNVLGAPCTATDTDYVAALETKWAGLTANDVNVTIDTGLDALGIEYTIDVTQEGAGTPDISDALDAFGNNWNTIVVNSYGTVENIMDALEAFNGIPLQDNPTGRFSGTLMKPFVALTGSTADDPTSITDARLADVTIAICPAPKSAGLPMEAAANMCVLFANKAQNTPHLDVEGEYYPDMPTPEDIGLMADYDYRDAFVKKGCSTVDKKNGKYQVQDLVTTYHPLGEQPPQYRYVRNLYSVDMNVYFTYYVNEQAYVVDHVIAADDDYVTAEKIIKPKQWTQVVGDLAENLAARALIVDAPFMKASISVKIGSSNPDRLETNFKYKRSGVARILSTTAQAGFNFGSV